MKEFESKFFVSIDPQVLQLTMNLFRDYLGLDVILQSKVYKKHQPLKCLCYGIDAVEFTSLKQKEISVSDLKQLSRAATGCGSCLGSLEQLIKYQYLNTMGDGVTAIAGEEQTFERQLEVLSQLMDGGKPEKYLCKCFKLTLADLWKHVNSATSDQYPFMGRTCKSCLEDNQLEVPLDSFFYYQGKSFAQWATIFADWLTEHKVQDWKISDIKSGEVFLSKRCGFKGEKMNDPKLNF